MAFSTDFNNTQDRKDNSEQDEGNRAFEATEPGFLHVNIKNSNGNIVKMKVKKRHTVERILKGYCGVKKVNHEDYRLIYKGEFLADFQTLEDYNIPDMGMLHIVTQQTGGK